MKKEIDFGQIVIEIVKSGNIPLPVFNPIAIKVQKLIEDNPDLGKIIELVSMDSKLSAAVLQTVNSPFYGLSIPKKTVSDAINYLGLEESGNVVVSAALSGNFTSKDEQLRPYMAKLWKHNLGCAIACQWLAKEMDDELSSMAFLSGMLHDFGKLTLLSAIQRSKRQKEMAQIPVTDHLIAETFAKFHAEQGYRTLSEMNLPQEYCIVARDHHMEFPNMDDENSLLRLTKTADIITKEIGLSATEVAAEAMDVSQKTSSGIDGELLADCKEYLMIKMRL
jgi:HD-like signal output (HDOD) protein